MKRICKILVLLALALLCASCSRVGDVKVLHYKLIAANPESSHKLNFILAVQVCNNGPGFDIDEMEGDLFKQGKAMCTFRAKPLSIPGNTTQWLNLEGDMFIEEGISLLSLLNMAQNFKVDDFTLNYMAKVSLGPLSKRFSGNDIALTKFLGGKLK